MGDCQAKNRILGYYLRMINPMELPSIQVRIREAIKSSNLNQKEIAAALHVTPQTISKYMKKNIFPALDTFAKLCKLLDVKADYILGISDY